MFRSPGHFVASREARGVVSFLQVMLGIALSFVVGALAFSINPPIDPFMAVLVLLALSVTMYALGMLIASISRTLSAANAIGFILFMLLTALGGMFAPHRDAALAVG